MLLLPTSKYIAAFFRSAHTMRPIIQFTSSYSSSRSHLFPSNKFLTREYISILFANEKWETPRSSRLWVSTHPLLNIGLQTLRPSSVWSPFRRLLVSIKTVTALGRTNECLLELIIVISSEGGEEGRKMVDNPLQHCVALIHALCLSRRDA